MRPIHELQTQTKAMLRASQHPSVACDEHGQEISLDGIGAPWAQEAVEELRGELAQFLEQNAALVEQAYVLRPEYATSGLLGHDYWLARSGHGAAFGDRGLGNLGEQLAQAAHDQGTALHEIGADGRARILTAA